MERHRAAPTREILELTTTFAPQQKKLLAMMPRTQGRTLHSSANNKQTALSNLTGQYDTNMIQQEKNFLEINVNQKIEQWNSKANNSAW